MLRPSKRQRLVLLGLVPATLIGLSVGLWYGPLTNGPSRELGSHLLDLHEVLQRPPSPGKSGYWESTLLVEAVDGLPDAVVGREAKLSFAHPDRLRLEARIDDQDYAIARSGNALWFAAPRQKLTLLGSNEVPRFVSHPDSVVETVLPDHDLPITRWQLRLLPALLDVHRETDGRLVAKPRSWITERFTLPDDATLSLTPRSTERDIDAASAWPARLVISDGEALSLTLSLSPLLFNPPSEDAAADPWTPPNGSDESVERVSLSHLVRFLKVSRAHLEAELPPLPPVTGERRLIARHGKGRLEVHDGTKVLFLSGSPAEMGEQHGTLMGEEARHLVDRILYGVGIGSSFDKGRWFFGEIESAQARLEPHLDPRYLEEMDALAVAAGLHPQEARLANFFPELFHCTGFALHGAATHDGRLYHGRVLDYLRGLGLEENAVVMVVQPDRGNAWVNVGYAGFVGSVTAMNEKQLAIGEMGGRGEGQWDGKPMAQLMREVMERADTIEEALEIFRNSPRTCEYYYVISDAKSGRAVGIKATPEIFETVWSGEAHPQLPHPVEDAVLLSAGDRYEELVRRVKADWGEFDADSARELMSRPVCMTSNIQSVLFAPDTLDFWVANADDANVASHTRYTRYNLAELLGRKAPVANPVRREAATVGP